MHIHHSLRWRSKIQVKSQYEKHIFWVEGDIWNMNEKVMKWCKIWKFQAHLYICAPWNVIVLLTFGSRQGKREILIYTAASNWRKINSYHWFSLSLPFLSPSNPKRLTLIMICPYHLSPYNLFVSSFLILSVLLSPLCCCFLLPSAALLSEVSQSLGISGNPNRLESKKDLRESNSLFSLRW